jgi:hypothetical protein
MFAKIYETSLGQILVVKDANEGSGNPEVRTYFEPEGLGICNVAATMKDDSDESWDAVDKLFDNMTEEVVTKTVKKIISEILSN